jgi:hypothetical protein
MSKKMIKLFYKLVYTHLKMEDKKMKTTILIRIQTQIAGTWKKFLAGGYLLFTALCLCMAITYCFGANQGKIIFDLEGTPPFKHVPADVFPVFMTVSIILIILVAWIHAIVIKKKNLG